MGKMKKFELLNLVYLYSVLGFIIVYWLDIYLFIFSNILWFMGFSLPVG